MNKKKQDWIKCTHSLAKSIIKTLQKNLSVFLPYNHVFMSFMLLEVKSDI